MKILALENSTSHGSVALLEDSAEPIIFEYQNDRKHSGAFFQSLESLSDRLRGVESIVAGLGPGSYAGVRIAIATAIGLQRTAGALLLGLPSICAIDSPSGDYCVVGDARRASFFFAQIRANKIVEGIDLYAESELHARLENVDEEIPVYSAEVLPQFPRCLVRYPSALRLGRLLERGVVSALKAPLEPIYLREPHITIANEKRNVSLLG